MDRRQFCKTILLTPIFGPLLLDLKYEKKGLHLYIISDSPQDSLPTILQQLHNQELINGLRFTFLNSLPAEKSLKKILSQKGWKHVFHPSLADFSLFFSNLRHSVYPSFTLVKDGRILDVRTKKLLSLWKEMYHQKSPSTWLTTASFQFKQTGLFLGGHAAIYLDGHKRETISLKKNFSKTFQSQRGSIAVTVKNGKAFVSNSSCLHKICQSTLPVQYVGERIICAPNHFLLEIQGVQSIDTVIG